METVQPDSGRAGRAAAACKPHQWKRGLIQNPRLNTVSPPPAIYTQALQLISIVTRKCSIAASPILDCIIVSVPKYNFFCKHIEITLNVILYEFIVSRVGYIGILSNYSLENI